MFDQNVGLNQIQEDWEILSFAARWQGSSEFLYEDCRNNKTEKNLLKKLWKLLDKADIIVGHNVKRFDRRKINARLIKDFPRPSSYKIIDTLSIAKSEFAFTSNKLEHLAKFLGVKHQKESHRKYPGHNLWSAVLKNEADAWTEMEKYNKQDVLALEDVYNKLIPWKDSINFNLYHNNTQNICKCGSKEFKKNGFDYTKTGKFQRYACKTCGSESRDAKNLFSKEKRASLRR